MSRTHIMIWDPVQYARFRSERLRPALDLLDRIALGAPAEITDLGCGSGNVTTLLAKRWPQAEILGVDSSPTMLSEAARAAPTARFQQVDIAEYVPEQPLALLFSNAALQWLPDHPHLLPRLFSFLSPGGVLAVQVPATHGAPYRTLQRELARKGPWASQLSNVPSARPILTPDAYFDLLAPHAASLEIWETTYLHVLKGRDAVLRWTMGTSLRPYLDALTEPLRSAFLEAYRTALRPHYPGRPDGITLFPFQRLFLLAEAPGRPESLRGQPSPQ